MGIGDRLRVRRDSHGNITLEKLEASFARNISAATPVFHANFEDF